MSGGRRNWLDDHDRDQALQGFAAVAPPVGNAIKRALASELRQRHLVHFWREARGSEGGAPSRYADYD